MINEGRNAWGDKDKIRIQKSRGVNKMPSIMYKWEGELIEKTMAANTRIMW